MFFFLVSFQSPLKKKQLQKGAVSTLGLPISCVLGLTHRWHKVLCNAIPTWEGVATGKYRFEVTIILVKHGTNRILVLEVKLTNQELYNNMVTIWMCKPAMSGWDHLNKWTKPLSLLALSCKRLCYPKEKISNIHIFLNDVNNGEDPSVLGWDVSILRSRQTWKPWSPGLWSGKMHPERILNWWLGKRCEENYVP